MTTWDGLRDLRRRRIATGQEGVNGLKWNSDNRYGARSGGRSLSLIWSAATHAHRRTPDSNHGSGGAYPVTETQPLSVWTHIVRSTGAALERRPKK
ncbi:MAG: hypothetical protein QOJ98_3547 [Acidobacteriota bacterium]|nr:hypothetical protein [Acidobacteriota bacterium]